MPGSAPRRAILRRVVVLVFDGAQLLDVAGPAQTFASATELGTGGGYAITLVSPRGGLITTSAGIAIQTEPLAAARGAIDTLVVVGGPGVGAALENPALLARLRAWSQRARRTCSVCTGAFLLAAAGLLDGRRRPRTGATARRCSSAIRRCASSPTRSSCRTARCGPRPG